jgi:hypothetical protein
MKVKEKIEGFDTQLIELFSIYYNIRHYEAFPTGLVHLKKPSVGPKGLIGPPCHGVAKKKLFL